MSEPLRVPCHACAQPMARVEQVAQTDQSPAFDCYRCNDEACGRKAIVVFEPAGGLTAPQQSFVQQEIARRGAFFPADYGAQRGPRNW